MIIDRLKNNREDWPFWTLAIFVCLTFAMGGGARADIQSLIILQPLAVIFCGLALLTLKRDHVESHEFLLLMAALIFALVALHLIPLPSFVWQLLPGRTIIAEIDRTVGLGEVWRPISMVPSATWSAFYSLFIPLAALLLGVQLNREQKFALVKILLGVGLLSGLWGLLQIAGDRDGPLYLYRITNNGTAVGLFSNRNHNAIFLTTLFPMLAVFAPSHNLTTQQKNVRLGLCIVAGLVLVPLLLLTGSRAGLLIGLFGVASILFLYRRAPEKNPLDKRAAMRKPVVLGLIGGLSVMALGAMAILMSRAEALDRLINADQVQDLRYDVWQLTAEIAWKYFPVGSGIGSFVEIYQISEPENYLSVSYVNHAHNDFLELLLTAGLPGVMILLIAAYALIRRGRLAFATSLGKNKDLALVRLGLTVICLLALGSVADYPLRVPSLSVLWVIAAIWASGSFDNLKARKG